MIFGSVCSGIEAASVAWHPLGWRAAFFSEIDAFPLAVLGERWPGVSLHGDFTTIQAGNYEAIDLLVGGTPCQDFSVAGLRAGLTGDRGGLTIEFVHLARRLRPHWLVWENVPGILSIDNGQAFGTFLALLGQCGYGFAYRILDAQHFGVPQRRRRVFVVGYLGDWRPAAAVLFEPESLRGDPPPRQEAEKRVAARTVGCLDAGGGNRGLGQQAINANLIAFGGNNQSGALDVAGRGTPIIPLQYAEQIGRKKRQNGMGIGDDGDPMFTLETRQPHGIGVGTSVRRLTPRECERLQGFPDDYTAITYRGKSAANGPRYRALGNSMCVNVMSWIGLRIDHVSDLIRSLETERTAA